MKNTDAVQMYPRGSGLAPLLLTLKSVKEQTRPATEYIKCYRHLIPTAIEISELGLDGKQPGPALAVISYRKRLTSITNPV